MSPAEYELTVYFAPHFPDYLAPLQSDEFLTNFKMCDMFILEYAEPWVTEEPDKETQYNQLSGGKVCSVPSKWGTLTSFSQAMQATIRGSRKRIVLERSTAPNVELSPPSDLFNSLVSLGLDGTLMQYKKQVQDLANSMIERDRCLIRDLLQQELKKDIRAFMFRGSAHLRHLSALLHGQFPTAKCVVYQAPTSLSDRILGSLTVGESVRDLDFLRSLHSELSKRGADYDSYMEAQSEAELLTEEQIRESYPSGRNDK